MPVHHHIRLVIYAIDPLLLSLGLTWAAWHAVPTEPTNTQALTLLQFFQHARDPAMAVCAAWTLLVFLRLHLGLSRYLRLQHAWAITLTAFIATGIFFYGLLDTFGGSLRW